MTSTQELLQLIQQLPAGDQVRLLNFAKALHQQRQGKRQKRVRSLIR